MSANRPGRRPDPVPERASYYRDGHQDRDRNRDGYRDRDRDGYRDRDAYRDRDQGGYRDRDRDAHRGGYRDRERDAYRDRRERADESIRFPPSMRNMGYGEVQEATENKQPRWEWWLCGAGLVVAVLVVASLLSPWARHQWALSLGRQPTPHTQLGFNDAVGLPVTAVRGKGIPISFAITNDEGKAMSYQYVVASGSGTKLETLSTATETVAAGASLNVKMTVVPKCAAAACRVQVSLPRQRETIDFLVTYQNKSSAKSK